MSNFTELSQVNLAPGETAKFFVRWRGKQEGPYSAEVIEEKLAKNEIGLLHEILQHDEWITIHDYIADAEATLRARQHEELQNRKREEATHKTRAIGTSPTVWADKVRNTIQLGDSAKGPIVNRRLARKAISGVIILACICASVWLVNYFIAAIHKTDEKAEYNKQRYNPSLKEATEKAWKQMQAVEFQAASGNPDPVTYFSRVAFGYSQIDADDADPELKNYILMRVDAAKAAKTVLDNVNEELQKSESGRDDMANIGQLFGTALGAILSSQKDSNVSVESGMQLGQFFGRLAGSVAGQATISDKDILSKYSVALQTAGDTYQGLSRERTQLGQKLGKKYQILLIDAAN